MDSRCAPFRDHLPSCPRCRLPLSASELAACPQCQGIWIAEAALAERVAVMQEAPASMTLESTARAALACAVCTIPMGTFTLWQVPIDRCPEHGVWFDRDELGTVLLECTRHPGPLAPSPAPARECTLNADCTRLDKRKDTTIGDVIEGVLALPELLVILPVAGVIWGVSAIADRITKHRI